MTRFADFSATGKIAFVHGFGRNTENSDLSLCYDISKKLWPRGGMDSSLSTNPDMKKPGARPLAGYCKRTQ